ncbi:DUF787 family protein (plasmid) [Borrelia coriaceae]|uniref:Uncharacterized protein n=1 Tax=Borrelia coriaceae ATCC 43381 TaxID=1408429 RepID=W5SVZ5_9SPIR|nr:DUF787 family protein [Borrelia coriaceae]AHH11110.1 Hypothetical protein BCO_0021300 [Borrelia coriaceae ATCC 43381]UPA17012.1 DUF787 family protein [Borrelia coriaceae]
MPQDTINVNLIEDTMRLDSIGYYNPLLIYKSEVLNEEHFVLNVSNFRETLSSLEIKREFASDDEKLRTAAIDRKLLADGFIDFFNEEGLKSCSFYVYKDIKKIVDFLKKNIHPFVVFVGVVKEIWKRDYDAIKGLVKFVVFSTHRKELPEFLEVLPVSQRDGFILIYDSGDDHLHLKFTAKYLHEASVFHATNPYGMTLKAQPIYDATLINFLRRSNINFYTLLNETGRDGVLAFKEGVDCSGKPIDEAFTYYFLKNESTRELIRIWNKNNRQNSKLSQLKFSDGKPNAYTAGLECLFKEFKERGLIVSFGDIKFKLQAENILGLSLSIRIKYNDSFKSVVLNISSDDINDYLRREAD